MHWGITDSDFDSWLFGDMGRSFAKWLQNERLRTVSVDQF